MGVTITAVPAAGAEPLSPPMNSERDLLDFAASVRSSPMAGMPQAANPAALAGEIMGGLKGYFDKAQAMQDRIMSQRLTSGDGAGVNVASLEPSAGPEGSSRLPGSEETAGDGSMSEFRKVGLAELERAQELALQSQFFLAETTVVTHAAGNIPHSINTLLKGQ